MGVQSVTSEWAQLQTPVSATGAEAFFHLMTPLQPEQRIHGFRFHMTIPAPSTLRVFPCGLSHVISLAHSQLAGLTVPQRDDLLFL